MSQNLYELIALGARYLFAALMLLIVIRAWRITLVDSRRAASLRRMSPETGVIGELVVTQGDEKARRGMRYPVIREGMIGSSRRADIRIRHSSVRRTHAYFQLTDDGLSVRTHAGAPMRDRVGRPVKSLMMLDGARFELGKVRLLLVLTEAPEPAHLHRSRRREDEASHEVTAGDLFRENPVLRHGVDPEPVNLDGLFDTDKDDW